MHNVNSMDQNSKKHGLHSNGSIDITEVLSPNRNEKKKAARKRWAILAKALKSPTGSEPSSPTDEFSVRRISSFMLLTTQLLENVDLSLADLYIADQIRKRTWYKYSMTVETVDYFVKVGHRIRTFSAEDLMGFNNTGNVCIWPSEETLTYYIGANLHILKGKTVLELGGGMSCLAGLICAKYGAAKCVTLTDGNKISVENVQISLYNNEFSCPVACKILKWEEHNEEKNYDIILCADCLFFDEGRVHLIECLWNVMSLNSLALVMAPRRGNTLENFIIQAQERGFVCKQIVKYNHIVWEKHLALLDNCEYDEKIHYPILIEVTKSQVTLGIKVLRADYWKSQDRKYCDFCKCWIADNKPSVEFHEKGRRHKENVSKRLKAIQKKSRRDEKESIRVDAALQHMEAAALEAYRKDVESNADLTSMAINKKVQDDNLAINSTKKIWHEAKSSSGQTYYWNTVTNESAWEPPTEGYLSIAEQKEAANEATKKQMKVIQKHDLVQERIRSEEEKKQQEEERARLAREKLKARRVEDLPPVVLAPIIPAGKLTPYGQWQTVKTRESTIDLQLPQQEFDMPVIIEPEPEPASREFKEKVVESLGSGSEGFKRRRIGAAAKQNKRQRLDDE